MHQTCKPNFQTMFKQHIEPLSQAILFIVSINRKYGFSKVCDVKIGKQESGNNIFILQVLNILVYRIKPIFKTVDFI